MDFTDILIPIRKVVRAINLDSKRIQKETGLSIPQLLTLIFISRSENYQCSQLELRNYLQLNSSTMTGIVGRLEKKGFVAKLPKKEDKRITYLTLTSAGSQVLEHAPPLLQERLAKQLTKLSPGQVDQIKNGLDLLVKVMGAESIDASPILSNSDSSNQ